MVGSFQNNAENPPEQDVHVANPTSSIQHLDNIERLAEKLRESPSQEMQQISSILYSVLGSTYSGSLEELTEYIILFNISVLEDMRNRTDEFERDPSGSDEETQVL